MEVVVVVLEIGTGRFELVLLVEVVDIVVAVVCSFFSVGLVDNIAAVAAAPADALSAAMMANVDFDIVEKRENLFQTEG